MVGAGGGAAVAGAAELGAVVENVLDGEVDVDLGGGAAGYLDAVGEGGGGAVGPAAGGRGGVSGRRELVGGEEEEEEEERKKKKSEKRRDGKKGKTKEDSNTATGT